MRLPRFNLRVALALTTVAAYIAWQVGMVHQRMAAMRGDHVFVLERDGGGGINLIRDLLGDEPVRYVYIVPLSDYRGDTALLAHLFPEAEVKPIENRRAFD